MNTKMKVLLCGVFAAAGLSVFAAEKGAAASAAEAMFTVNNLWVMIAGMLVFMMHLGFASVESGLSRAKNCTNILFKNTLVPPIGFITFAVMGFSLMYPGEGNWIVKGLLGFGGFGIGMPEGGQSAGYNGAFTYWTDFFFQGMFAATAATIVSGAVAERIHVKAFMIFTVIYVMLVYPLVGSWGWGGGWLAELKFHDFAGSTFVHSVGGWGALAGVILLGPRIGKYVGGKPMPIMGHNMPLVCIGVFLLWFGWFGFNGGSVLNADPNLVSLVLVTTMLGACAGIIMSMTTSIFLLRKPDLSMTLNGCLAGLVAVTAGADCITPLGSILIGGIGGTLVVFSVMMFDRLQLDDPVGALSVHLVCGIWGTVAVGIFSTVPEYTVMSQTIGLVSCGIASFGSAFLIFGLLKRFYVLRVTPEEELKGLDLSEHSMEAYPGFQVFTNI